jgi:hypothetical protein
LASTVYTAEEVELQDGTVVNLKPLNIKSLRKFMKIMEKFANVESEEQGLDILIDASAVCLSRQKPEFYDASKGENGGASEEWEDVADMPTVYKILDVCGGVRLNDPNLLAAAEEALGKTST